MCACRGTAGLAHVSCLAEQAKILRAEGSRVDGKLTCADIGLEDGDQLVAENVQDAVAARDE